VFAPLLRRRRPILDLARGDVHDQLGRLGIVPWGVCEGSALPVPLHYDSERYNNDSASGGSEGVGADRIDSDAKAIVRDDLR
jgi:hypothetical protein